MDTSFWTRPVKRDCVATLLIAAVVVVAWNELAQLPSALPHPAGGLLVLASVLPAAVRRPWPRSALAVTTVASACAMALSAAPAVPLAVAYVMYLVPFRFSRRTGLWLLAGTLAVLGAGLTVFGVMHHGPGGPAGGSRAALTLVAASWALVAGAWVVGELVRQRRAYDAVLREQAEQVRREEIAEARRAATATRVGIARELHDVVAHSLSLIAVQAGVANWVVESRPAEAARALTSIEEISRGALREMRALLGVLRVDETELPAESAAFAPARGLADLPELAERVSAAGPGVTVTIDGTPAPLLPGLDLAAYRVVQEAVTNVVKHAGATTCQVIVGYQPGTLTLEITDNGRGRTATPSPPAGGHGATPAPTPAVPGHGLTGMRERVTMYGGELTTGPAPGGGFRVTASFPLSPAEAAA